MKNIIIFGEPRSGKSTLANMIVDRFNYQVIHVDSIRDTFKKIYPELDIAPDRAIKNKKFQLFLQEYLYRNTIKEERNKYGYVMEGCETSVCDCNELYNNDNNIIYFLGQINITSKELFNNIRNNDSNHDWTFNRSDDELMEICKKIILNSKKQKKECEKYHIKFIDTNCNRNKVLNEILNDIEIINNN